MKTKKVDKKKNAGLCGGILLYGCFRKVHDGGMRCMSMYIPFMTGGMITVALIRLP